MCEILIPKTIYELTPRMLSSITPFQAQNKAEETAIPKSSSKHFDCVVCQVEDLFIAANKKLHLKSDWHLYNLHLDITDDPPVSRSQFELILHELSDVSEDEVLEKLKRKHNSKNRSVELGQVVMKNPLFKEFCHNNTSLYVYQQIYFEEKSLAKNVQDLAESKILILLLSGGRFAGAVFDNKSKKMLIHKNIQRYTTRRKQGGSQTSNDQAKGKAKSAGAMLRRYNEQKLIEDIKDCLNKWNGIIKETNLMFIRLGSHHNNTEFYRNSVLKKDDPRIRKIPFTTTKPCIKELHRIYSELFKVHYSITMPRTSKRVFKQTKVSPEKILDEMTKMNLNLDRNITSENQVEDTDYAETYNLEDI